MAPKLGRQLQSRWMRLLSRRNARRRAEMRKTAMKHYIYARRRAVLLALGLLAMLLAGCGVPGTIATGGSLPPIPSSPTAAPLPPIRFPQDEAPHRDLTEWWYYTGHLSGQDSSGKTHLYGFEF